LYHPSIVHLCNVKEVSLLKRLILKSLIYLFYLFVSHFITNSYLSHIPSCNSFFMIPFSLRNVERSKGPTKQNIFLNFYSTTIYFLNLSKVLGVIGL